MAKRLSKRPGPISAAEHALVETVVAQAVLDQPTPITPAQTRGLATFLRRTPETVAALIETAKARALDHLDDYVEIHYRTTQQAEQAGEFATALKGAEWAMEHLGSAGARVVERETKGEAGPRIQIGIQLGGLKTPVTDLTVARMADEADV